MDGSVPSSTSLTLGQRHFEPALAGALPVDSQLINRKRHKNPPQSPSFTSHSLRPAIHFLFPPRIDRILRLTNKRLAGSQLTLSAAASQYLCCFPPNKKHNLVAIHRLPAVPILITLSLQYLGRLSIPPPLPPPVPSLPKLTTRLKPSNPQPALTSLQ